MTAAKFLVMALVCAVAAHLAVSGLVAAVLAVAYTHRIPDVSRWKGAPIERLGFIGVFLGERLVSSSRPTVLFGGSSFTFGYPWHEAVIFSRAFASARPETYVVNASLLAGDISSVNDWVVCGAVRAGVRPDVLVVEIPVVNAVSLLAEKRRNGLRKASPLAVCDSSEGTPGYFWFAVRQILGLGWLHFLWDNEAYLKEESTINIGPVPEGYFVGRAEFEMVRVEFESQVAELLRNAQRLATSVYAYPSPVYVAGLREAGADGDAVQYQLEAAQSACLKVRGVHCIDPAQRFASRDYYFNLTHLNQRGHRTMGEWLARSISF